MVDRAGLLQLVGQQTVALVEKQDAELFDLGKGHRRTAIFDHRGPRGQHFALGDRPFGQRQACCFDDFDVERGLFAQTFDRQQARHRCTDHLGNRTELADQQFGERFDIALRNGAE